MLVTPTHATATGGFVAVNLVSRIPGLGRVRSTNPLNSLPETRRSSWIAIQPTFV